MDPTYAYERRPQLFDRWILARQRNRFIERAPVVVLTGAGASIPAGIPGLALPKTLRVAPGVELDAAELVPAAAATTPGDVLDLESLLIAADVLQTLPRDVVHHGLRAPESGESDASRLETNLAVLGATVRMTLPRLAGGASLSPAFVDAVVERLIALDRRHERRLLDHLSEAITDRIYDACLALAEDRLVDLYAPLLDRLAGLLERAGAPLVVPVFTTNYDETFDFLGVERRDELARRIGRPVRVFDATAPWPGFPGWRRFDAGGYRRFRPAGAGGLDLVVFYLHGSLRWLLSAEARPWFEIQVADRRIAHSPQMPRYRALLQPDAQKVLWGRSHRPLSDLLAPRRKDPFRPGAPYYPMGLGYRYFERCVGRPGALLAIGYSFRDSDCRDLLLAGWRGEGGGRRLVLLDPSPGPVLARLGPEAPVATVPAPFAAASMDATAAAVAAALSA